MNSNWWKEGKCIRCGMPLQEICLTTGTKVCVPCLLAQGDRYVKTGDKRVFFGRSGYPLCPEYERQ